jgi:hypothetical protein
VSRQTRQRRRSAVDVTPATDARPLTPVERSRLHQRYARLAGRSVVVGYASYGIVVRASTPDEMVAATDAVIVEASQRQPPS